MEIYRTRIKMLRVQTGTTVREIARYLGISPRTYIRIEQSDGRKSSTDRVSMDLLISLAKYYSISSNYILGNINNEKYCTLPGPDCSAGIEMGYTKIDINRFRTLRESHDMGLGILGLISKRSVDPDVIKKKRPKIRRVQSAHLQLKKSLRCLG